MQNAIPGIGEILNRDIPCPCGRTHRVRTRRVALETDLAGRLPGHIRDLGLPERILLIADRNTWAAAGAEIAAALAAAGMVVTGHVIPGESIHTDERAVGSVMLAAEPAPGLLVAVGSGSINDLGRFCAARMRIPYLTVATASSMDGYASTVTPVTRAGLKVTYPGIHPEMVAADPGVLAAAPRSMAAAGLGDLIGKHTARLDWLLARTMMDEAYCPVIAAIMEKALCDCVALAPALGQASPGAAAALMEALTLSGLAMQMQGDSRPASGSEHHISHFLEMRDALRGRPPALHGDKVGAASLLVMRLYEKFFAGDPPARGPASDTAVRRQEIARVYGPLAGTILQGLADPGPGPGWDGQWARLVARWDDFKREAGELPAARARYARALRAAGGPAALTELGYGRDDIRDALLYAWIVRSRFTLLSLLAGRGRLASLAEEVLDELDP